MAYWEEVIYRIKRNPVLLGGLVLSVLEATQGLSWRAAVPVAVAVIVRFFTVPLCDVEPVSQQGERAEK